VAKSLFITSSYHPPPDPLSSREGEFTPENFVKEFAKRRAIASRCLAWRDVKRQVGYLSGSNMVEAGSKPWPISGAKRPVSENFQVGAKNWLAEGPGGGNRIRTGE
jgi:hypothetical protein